VREAQRTDAWLVVPDLEYGKALDQVLDTRLEDFREDPDVTPQALGPGRSRYERISRLNPYRVLEVEIDRIEGEATLHQYYVSAHPHGPRETCDLPVALAGEDRLLFDQGVCRVDRSQDPQIQAVCTWLGIPVLRTLAQPEIAPASKVCQALTGSRDEILARMERNKLEEFKAWMTAWRTRYFAGTPLRPTTDKPHPWVIRALEEVILEFGIRALLQPQPALPTRGAPPATGRALRTRGGVFGKRQEAEAEDLAKNLVEVAQAFSPDGPAARGNR
jgi:hypothetical protein